MGVAVYLDLIALIPPIVGLFILSRQKSSIGEVKNRIIARMNIYFVAAVAFDIPVNLGIPIAAIGTFVSLYLVFASVGFLAAILCFCPESRSLLEAIRRVLHTPFFPVYHITLIGWLVTTIILQSTYLPATLVLWAASTLYPTRLFLLARTRARVTHAKDMLTILSICWLSLGLITLPILVATSYSSFLGVPFSTGWQLNFVTSSLFFYFVALALTNPSGLTRLWMTRIVPQTIIEFGRRYLVLHDRGSRTLSFVSTTFRSMISSGSKIIINTPQSTWLLESLSRTEPKFNHWVKSGRLVRTSETENPNVPIIHAITEKINPGPVATIYVTGLEPNDLTKAKRPGLELTREKGMASELFFLEKTSAPKPQVSEFLKRNGDVQLLDLSEPKDYFSELFNLAHAGLQGSAILLEYSSDSNPEDAVGKFLTEGVANAELCVLFTARSSKLYRAMNGRNMVRIVAASSLVSAPDELPGGEIQIPDRELGLVTSISSDFIENNKNLGISFVFDSITELISGDRWEQAYSGVKQLVELLSIPNVTTILLINRDVLDQQFLGALRAIFPVQMTLDDQGLRATKLALS